MIVKKRNVLWLLIIIVCGVACYADIVYHERLHQLIFLRYGVDSEVEINFFRGVTRGDRSQINEMDTETYNQMMFQHHVNEAVDYNLTGIR